MKKHILVAAVGMSPQVVTETIFTLAKRGIVIHEVYVLTTSQSPVENFLKENLPVLAQYLNIKKPKFSKPNIRIYEEPEQMLSDDINSRTRSSEFTNLACVLLKELTSKKENVIHCSIAGGRKTMSVAMAVGMMLFGRKQDTLSHIIASKQFETSRRAFPKAEEEDQVILFDVPYIRLHTLISRIAIDKVKNFSELVELAQKVLDQRSQKAFLQLHEKELQLRIETSIIKLQPMQFAFYSFIKDEKEISVNKSEENTKKFYNRYQRFTSRRSDTSTPKIGVETFRKLRSEINKEIEKTMKDSANLEKYLIKSTKEGMNVKYSIPYFNK